MWAEVAEANISSITARSTLIRGSFEERVGEIPGPIDVALVDGIHTYDFVIGQWQILLPRLAESSIVFFDDIDFARPGSRMREAWSEIASHPRVIAAAEIGGRLGVVEVSIHPEVPLTSR